MFVFWFILDNENRNEKNHSPLKNHRFYLLLMNKREIKFKLFQRFSVHSLVDFILRFDFFLLCVRIVVVRIRHIVFCHSFRKTVFGLFLWRPWISFCFHFVKPMKWVNTEQSALMWLPFASFYSNAEWSNHSTEQWKEIKLKFIHGECTMLFLYLGAIFISLYFSEKRERKIVSFAIFTVSTHWLQTGYYFSMANFRFNTSKWFSK